MSIHWSSTACLVLLLATISTSPANAQSYVLDDGKVDAYLGQDPLFSQESGAIQGFTVLGGGTDLIESLSVLTTPFWYFDSGGAGPTLGQTIKIAVWDDPNGDRNPSDAVLLGSYSGHTVTNEGTGQFVTYAFPTPIAVTGSFFAGIVVPAQAPGSAVICIDDGEGYRWDSWYFNNASAPVDLVNLGQNWVPPSPAFITGRFMIRANDGDYGTDIGVDSCLAAPNSDGVRGKLAASGNVDAATGVYRVHLTATRVPHGSVGFFLASQTQVPPFVPLGSQGRLCLGGTILRIGPSISHTLGRMFSWDVDLGNVDSFGAPVPGVDVVTVGQTWTFQGWHRDLDPDLTSNLTEAITVTFQ